MSNITIGLIARDDKINNTLIQIVTKNNLKYLHNKCNYIGILNYDNSLLNTNILSLCDGIIFQGICMGHQIIGLYSQNTTNDKALIKIPNHNNKEKTHDIKIKPNTILYKIFGPTLTVNSRHNEALSKVNYPFKVSAVSKDNVIEGIEYVDDNHFVLGVQFHPEDLDNTENLYNYFLKEVLKRKK